MKEPLIFKIIEFMYNHKLFGVHKKCWTWLVINYYIDLPKDRLKLAEIPQCDLCKNELYTYCGKRCGCTEDSYCELHREANEILKAWHKYNREHEEKLNHQEFKNQIWGKQNEG